MEKRWPKVGEKLVHRFRKSPGEAVAEVVSVNRKTGVVSVRVGNEVYSSLSSAAKAVSGASANGWTYWGLKKQVPPGQRC